MVGRILLILNVIVLGASLAVLLTGTPQPFSEGKVLSAETQQKKKISKDPPKSFVLPSGGFISQTFNNCGPASLSMALKFYGKDVSQDELGRQMRPYQNVLGDNDDKSIFVDEFVQYARKYGFESLNRANGDIELIKRLTTNGVPVIVRTWLSPYEDIGHFRIVRGFDEEQGVIIQDDSYQGANLTYTYDEFLAMWQPFNYGYILVYPKEKKDVVTEILEDEMDAQKAYSNSIKRAEKELVDNPASYYSLFNIATAQYHLGNYKQAVEYFEKAQQNLPWRMLWYQIEPIQAYEKLGNSERVFSLSQVILKNNNRAFTELYVLRGNIYRKQGNLDLARQEYENALFYNSNSFLAKEAYSSLSTGS